MSLDFEAPAQSSSLRILAVKNELSHISRTRKRKLCELYAVATANNTPIPEYRDARADAPVDTALIHFLEQNNLEKGRYFADSTLPTRLQYASNIAKTRQNKHSSFSSHTQATSSIFASTTGLENQQRSRPSPKKPLAVNTLDAVSTPNENDPSSRPLKTLQTSARPTEESKKQPLPGLFTSETAPSSTTRERPHESGIAPEPSGQQTHEQSDSIVQDDADPSRPALRSIRSSRPDSPPYSPGTDRNAAGAPGPDDPTYKDSNASSTILTPHRDDEQSAASPIGSGRSSPNLSNHVTTSKPTQPSDEDASKAKPRLSDRKKQQQPGSVIDPLVAPPAETRSSTSDVTAHEGLPSAGEGVVGDGQDKRILPPMASFGNLLPDKLSPKDREDRRSAFLAQKKKAAARPLEGEHTAAAAATSSTIHSGDPMEIDSFHIESSSALQPRKDPLTRVVKTRPDGPCKIATVTLNKRKGAAYSDIVQQLRKNRVPDKFPNKKRDYMQLFIMRQTFNSVYGRDLASILNNSNKTLTTSDWQARYREEEDNRILQRIYHLQDTNRWSLRLPKPSPEVPAPKCHWDSLLKDVKWLRTDFKEERKMKMSLARDLAESCAAWVQSSPAERSALQIRVAPPRTISKDWTSVKVKTPMKEEAVESIFTLPDTQVYFSGPLSSLDRRILEKLPFCGPVGCRKEQLIVEHTTDEAKMQIDEPKVVAAEPGRSSTPANPIKPAMAALMRDVEDVYEEEETKSFKRELDPEEVDCALFDPANKAMRTRLNTVWPFRPPNSSMPPQSFYECRHSSQWTSEDDHSLRGYVKDFPSNWSLIADRMAPKSMFTSYADRRTPWECFERLLTLEGPPSNAQQHQYLRHFHYRLEKARATFKEQQEAIQRQAQQAAQTSGHHPPPPTTLQKRFPTPMGVERKPNKRFLAMLDSARKLARKKESQLTKLQSSQAHSEAQAQQNRSAQMVGARTLQPPSYFSNLKFEREKKEQQRLNEIREHQRLQQQQQQQQQQQALEMQKRSHQAATNAAAASGSHGVTSQQQQQQQLTANAANAMGQQVRAASVASSNGQQPSSQQQAQQQAQQQQQIPAMNNQAPHLGVPQMVPGGGGRPGTGHANSMQLALQNGTSIQINGTNSGSAAAAVAAAVNNASNGARVLQANMGGGGGHHQRLPSGGAATAQMSQDAMQRMVQQTQQRRLMQQMQQSQQHQQAVAAAAAAAAQQQQHQHLQQQSPHFNSAAASHGSPNMSAAAGNVNGFSPSNVAAMLPSGATLSPGLPHGPANNSSSPSQMNRLSQPHQVATTNSSSPPPSSSSAQNPTIQTNSQQSQSPQGMTPQARPQGLSSGHIPQLKYFHHHIKTLHPQMSDADAQELATQTLKQHLIQTRQHAINAAAGVYAPAHTSPQQAAAVVNGASVNSTNAPAASASANMTATAPALQHRQYQAQLRAQMQQQQTRLAASAGAGGTPGAGSPTPPSAAMSASPVMGMSHAAHQHNGSYHNRTPTPNALPPNVMRPPSRHAVPVAVPDHHGNRPSSAHSASGGGGAAGPGRPLSAHSNKSSHSPAIPNSVGLASAGMNSANASPQIQSASGASTVSTAVNSSSATAAAAAATAPTVDG